MACVASPVFDLDAFDVAIFADYDCDVIKELNFATKQIRLQAGVTTYNPVDDIYREVRSIRKFDESCRVFDMPVFAQGNEPTDVGKFTPRRIQVIDPWKIVPHPDIQTLSINGEQISDVGSSGGAVMDFTGHNPAFPLAVNYLPVDAEIIVLTSGGSGASAQEVWEYGTRELTSAAGVTAQNISDIADAVWDEPIIGHTTIGTTGEKLGDTAATVDTAAIAAAVWSSVSRTLTESAGVTTQDIIDIVDGVWDEDITQHLLVNSAGARLTDNSIDGPELATIASAVWGSAARTLTDIPNIQLSDISSIATAVWAETTRALTADVSIEAVDMNSIITGVWAEPSRTVTAPVDVSTASEDAIRDKVWSNLTRTLTGDVSVATADINTITSQVWTETARTLTTYPALTQTDANLIADTVWDEGLAGHIVAGSAGKQLSDALINLDTAAISTAVWSEGVRELTSALTLSNADILAISAQVWDEQLVDHITVGSTGEALDDSSTSVDENLIAATVWADTTRTLTSSSDPTAAAIASAVWAETTRTITTAPSLLTADINTISAQVWTEPGRTLTSITAPTASAIATEVWTAAGRTLSTSLDPTANEIRDAVWSAISRTITGDVALATVSVNAVRDSVWSAVTRDLTETVDISTASVTTLSDSVWSNVARTLTGDVNVSSTSITSIETAVWGATVRDLTVDVGISATGLTNISDTVWTAASRTLTDSGLTVDETAMIKDLWQIGGLDPNNPVTNTQTQTTVDLIDIQYTGNSKTAVTSTRQP